jgi:purine nucleosidase
MTLRRVAIGVVLLLCGLGLTLALPVQTWRTGRMSVPSLALLPGDERSIPTRRVWIDTDAACGHTSRTDVDDCLALWLLAVRPELKVVGVSTVFGNAPVSVTDRTTRALVARLPWPDEKQIAVNQGARDTVRPRASSDTAAQEALIRALEAGPLTIVALGPLTNVAHVLEARPDLAKNVARLVAVMGRRMGHLFHPSEGSGRGTLLGHGPVFRDFNFSVDPEAARSLIAMNLPATLVPYDAARRVEITSRDLRRLARLGDAGSWIAERSEGWLEYWQSDVGRRGFYPFDVMAAAHVIQPSLFCCTTVHASVRKDPLMFIPLFRPEALLVEPPSSRRRANALYCPDVQEGFARQLRSWLFPRRDAMS